MSSADPGTKVISFGAGVDVGDALDSIVKKESPPVGDVNARDLVNDEGDSSCSNPDDYIPMTSR